MVSFPISKLKFWTEQGQPLQTPLEWEPAIVEIEVDDRDKAQLFWQDQELELYQKRIQEQWRIVANLPCSNPGYYRLTLNGVEQIITIVPRKISVKAFEDLLQDLDSFLPASVALALQQGGALAGINILSPHENTVVAELLRLKWAIEGNASRMGLKQLLPIIAHNPHKILKPQTLLVRTSQARRPSPTHLAFCLRGNNLDKNGNLVRVFDQQIKHTLDTYENRIVKLYVQQVKSRLKRLKRKAPQTMQSEIQSLSEIFHHAQQQTNFLEQVHFMTHLPNHLTMTLLKVPTYRAIFENYLNFQRQIAVSLKVEDNKILEAPLANLPKLYQLWGTLQVIVSFLKVSIELGYQIHRQQLCLKDNEGWFVQILPNNKPAIILSHPKNHTIIKLIPEHSYNPPQTMSFTQRPDIAIEVETKDGKKQIYLFDAKYKLNSNFDKPQKVDIDKMHAYRDAIIHQGKRVVKYAAILYPGEFQYYDEGLQALSAYPGKSNKLQNALYQVFHQFLKIQ